MIEKIFNPAKPHGDEHTPDMSQISGADLFIGCIHLKTLGDFAREQTAADGPVSDLPTTDSAGNGKAIAQDRYYR